MKTITARELRNEYARILQELEGAGEGYTTTDHGRPVARITPIAPVPGRLRAFSGAPFSTAASLNSIAGLFDHPEFDRQVDETFDPVARDPSAERDDEPDVETARPSQIDDSSSVTDTHAVRERTTAHGHEAAPRGPRLGDLDQQ